MAAGELNNFAGALVPIGERLVAPVKTLPKNRDWDRKLQPVPGDEHRSPSNFVISRLVEINGQFPSFTHRLTPRTRASRNGPENPTCVKGLVA